MDSHRLEMRLQIVFVCVNMHRKYERKKVRMNKCLKKQNSLNLRKEKRYGSKRRRELAN